jgi:hypothetical protein
MCGGCGVCREEPFRRKGEKVSGLRGEWKGRVYKVEHNHFLPPVLGSSLGKSLREVD